jgi:hypothetical protein
MTSDTRPPVFGDATLDDLDTTALVHEAHLRLSDDDVGRWHDRARFYAIAAIVR